MLVTAAIMEYLSVFAGGALVSLVYEPTTPSWNAMIADAYNRDMFLVGAWWGGIPPTIALGVMIGTVFVVLDSLSKVFEERVMKASRLQGAQIA